MKRVLLLMTALAPVTTVAETLYVTERLAVPVYGTPAEGPAVRTVEAGAALEVLERAERFARVRDRQGAEGWIDARYLVADAPARTQLSRANEELARQRRELADIQGKLKKAEGELNQQVAKGEALGKQLAAAQAAAATPAAPPPPEKPAPERTPATGEPASAGFGFSLPWLLIAFAMLGVGFVAGVVWLRESIKKRSGGMYLRV
jgi:hypothetical protein